MALAAPLITAAITGGITAGTGIGFLGLSAGFAAGFVGFAGSLALGFISSALQPKPKTQDFGGFAGQASGRTQTIRQPITSHKLIVGEVARIGGALTFYEATSSNRYHHMVVTIAAHEVQAIETVWLNDKPIYADQIDGSGAVTEGPFSGKVRIKKHLGADDQVADADLVSETTATDEFRQRGRAYVYLRIDWDRDTFPNGLPDPSFRVKGMKCEDPRVSGAAEFSVNAAVVLRRWMLYDKAKGGLGVQAARMDDDYAAAAANVCDEFVDTLPVTATASAVSASADTISLSGDKCPFQTGDRVELDTTGTAPGGLIAVGSPTDLYYVVVHQEQATDEQPVKIRLADTYDHAIAGTTIDITSAGSGTLTVTKNGEPRYTASGVIDTARKRGDILRDLSTALGRIPVYAGGKWRISAAAWASPTVTLTEDHLRGAITSTTRISRRERFNLVKGIYVSPLNDGQPTDYPAATSSAYESADLAERLTFDHDLPFTTRANAAQRLAWIVLKRHRNELAVTVRCNLSAYRVQAGDTVAVTNTVRGWSAKAFEVEESVLVPATDAKGNPILGVDLKLKAAASTDYDFDPATQEQTVDPSSLPTGPDLTPGALAGLALASGTAQLDVRLDGSVFSRIYASWTAPTDRFVVAGGKVEVQYKKSAASDWISAPAIEDPGSIAYAWILDVQDGAAYDVRVRAVNQIGVRGAWSTVSAHTVAGKTALPSDVASLQAQQTRELVTFKWPAITDLDRNGYEIRAMPLTAAFDWDAATEVTKETKGTLVTNGALAPGAWTVGIKAIDTTGNYSQNAATADVTVVTDFDTVAGEAEAPRWAGTKVNCIRHPVSGKLIPVSGKAASEDGIFAAMCNDPPATYAYTGKEIDLGFDADITRVYASMAAGLGPGHEDGTANPAFSIDYRDNADSYDGFEDWLIGLVDARFILPKVTVDTTQGVAWLSAFTPTADVEERTEHHNDETVPVGGATVTWNAQFHSAPGVQVSAEEPAGSPTEPRYPNYSSITATSGFFRVFDKAGNDVGGTVNITVTGP